MTDDSVRCSVEGVVANPEAPHLLADPSDYKSSLLDISEDETIKSSPCDVFSASTP
jgi:hypothetical protein